MRTLYSLVNAKTRTVTGTSAEFAAALSPKKFYRISSDVAFWYKFAATGGSVAASDDDAIYVGADQIEFDAPTSEDAAYLHVIRAGSTSGTVNIAEIKGTL